MPITWKNINQGSDMAAVRLLESAGRSINTGFDNFKGLLNEARTTDEANRATTIDNNTDAFLDRLNQFQSPEALQQAQASGELDRLRQGFGAMIDKDQTRGAVDQQVNTLRERTNQAYTFDQNRLEQEQAPVVENLRYAIANNDDATVRQLLEANPNLKNRAGLVTEFNSAERTRLEQTRGDAEYLRGENQRRGTELAQTRANEFLATAETSADGRAALNAWFQSDEGRNTPPLVRQQLLAGFDSNYTAATGLTQEQNERLNTTAESVDAGIAFELDRAKSEVDRVIADNPVDPVLSFEDKDRVTLGQTRAWARDYVDDWNLESNIDDALAFVKKDQKLTGKTDAKVPWGNLVRMAIEEAAQNETLFNDRDVDQADINKALSGVYSRWVQSTENKVKVREAEDSLAEKQKQLSSTRAKTLSELKAALKAEASIRKNGSK